VAELIQYRFTADTLSRELAPLLSDSDARNRMLSDYKELIERVGLPGASDRAAALMVENLQSRL